METTNNLWKKTPLIYSNHLSEVTDCAVYLKLENLHPSYSFKYRGISYFVKKANAERGPSVHLVIASGGNAGLAAACAARSFGLKCTVFIPEGVAISTLKLLKEERAEVIVGGAQYSDALKDAQDLVSKEANAVMVPAYDNPIIWEGHSSMIHEIKEQIPSDPDAIFCSVGGGGLLGGIMVGCKAVGWDNVPIVALETIGSDCFYRSMALNGKGFNSENKTLPPGIDLIFNEEHAVHLAHFQSFSSKASGSLGASEPAAGVVKMALQREGGVKTASVPDELSMETLLTFANDHKFLVELACSTTLVPAYHSDLLNKLVDISPKNDRRATLVFVVCGGFKIDMQTVAEYQKLLEQDPGETRIVRVDDGELFKVRK
ncbi:hypothetical protein HYPSUDRAFT_131092 [Hypholoma sublateritium FD-334 SS-4]|uniref:L-serine ammonia-lyase n=1 Tax=Hypholoma sublateritium (strain FD-334 SS-4) TaxID=945553 RepID=A0A0D2Q6M8_HYPSF|nr:hypothetical protein HYPSUDRAFT_131092 [Hypholoma sublateritium FD-334 SS-4]